MSSRIKLLVQKTHLHEVFSTTNSVSTLWFILCLLLRRDQDVVVKLLKSHNETTDVSKKSKIENELCDMLECVDAITPSMMADAYNLLPHIQWNHVIAACNRMTFHDIWHSVREGIVKFEGSSSIPNQKNMEFCKFTIFDRPFCQALLVDQIDSLITLVESKEDKDDEAEA